MVLEEAKDGATNPILPVVGEVDLGVGLAIALFVGLFMLKFIEPLSENAADYVSNRIASATGINPSTGETADNGGAFD